MIRICRVICLLVPAVFAHGQTDPQAQERDLHFKKDVSSTHRPTKVVVPRSYALIIGISKYPNLPKKLQLGFPIADAAGIYTTLINPEGGQFPAENVHQLLGPKATLANIRDELENWLPSVSKDDDRVLIYFAGHGIIWPQDGRAYLAPYDLRMDDIPHTAYSMDRLGEVFGSKIKAKWRVLLTDACHSGAILPATEPQTINQRLQNFSPSVFSLTASRDREQSFEGDGWGGGHGAFTYYVMQGLEGQADANGDGEVTADELAEYVHSSVRGATEGKQNPTSDRSSFDPNMLLAYNPTHVQMQPPEAPKSGSFVIEANMDGVEVFLDGNSQGVLNKGKPLRLPGITPGVHKIEGVHMGYEPYGPEEETIYPGQVTTVTVRITIVRRKNKAANDLFDKGMNYYTTGNQQNYRKAADMFGQALQLDPAYSRAALYLGRTYSALFDKQNADRFFRRAIEIDPDYLEARSSYAGTLLDEGNFESAIRQLNNVVQRDPDDGMAHYMLCIAFTRLGANDKENANAFKQALEEGREAVRLLPGKGEAHFWLAESLRMSGHWSEAEPEYNEYLKLSDFDSRIGGKLNYYVLGYLIGMGKKTRASQHDIWMDQRNLAYFGLCDCERLLKHFDNAIHDCQTSLTYDSQDPFAHYALAILFIEKSHTVQDAGLLIAARKHFSAVVDFNADTGEAALAKKYIKRIDTALLGSQQ